jgi:hypothetical protein
VFEEWYPKIAAATAASEGGGDDETDDDGDGAPGATSHDGL